LFVILLFLVILFALATFLLLLIGDKLKFIVKTISSESLLLFYKKYSTFNSNYETSMIKSAGQSDP